MDNQVGILDVLDQVLQTERTFYQSARILQGGRRETIIDTHQRNTAVLLGLIRSYMAVESPLYSVRYNVTVPNTLPPGWNDPVVVHATPEQILAATDTATPQDDSGNCAICQETLTTPATRIRHCGHSFHTTCISEWFTRSVHCPNCRHDIRNWTFDNPNGLPTLPPPRSQPLVRRRGVILTTDPPPPTSSAQVHTPPLANTQSASLNVEVDAIPHIAETASSDEHHA
jgi:hypothetical protein